MIQLIFISLTVTLFSTDANPSSALFKTEGSDKIIGIVKNKDSLAVMFSNSLQTYDVKLAEGKLQSVKNKTIHFEDFSFDDGVHRLLEFKFESENLLFFCTQMFCRTCDPEEGRCGNIFSTKYSEYPSFDRTLFPSESYEFRSKYFEGIRNIKGSYQSDSKRFLLRSVNDFYHAQIYSIDTRVGNITSIAIDALNYDRPEHRISLSFIDKEYTYFVGSTNHKFIPSIVINGSDYSVFRVDLRITRICNADHSLLFDSRMDMALFCGTYGFDAYKLDEDGANHTILSSTYSAEHRKLFLIFSASRQDQINKSKRTVPIDVACEYRMDDIQKSFEETWSTCQENQHKTSVEIHNMCHNDVPGAQCFIAALAPLLRSGAGSPKGKGHVCEKYGANWDITFNNCNLPVSDSGSEKFVWLENFRPKLYGREIASFENELPTITSIIDIGLHDSFVLTSDDGSIGMYKKRSPESNITLFWSATQNITGEFSAVFHKPSNSLIYAQSNQISHVRLECPYLFSSCEEISWKSSNECGWCFYKNGTGHSVNSSSANLCGASNGYFVSGVCPPNITKVERKSNEKELIIVGTNFGIVMDLTFSVCGKSCEIISETAPNVIEINCGSTKLEHCQLNLSGKIGNLTTFTNFTLIKEISPEKHPTRMNRLIAGIIGITLLLVTLGIIWAFYSNYAKKIDAGRNIELEKSRDLDFFGGRMSDSSPYGYEKSFGVAVGPCKDDELDRTKIHIIKYIGNGNSSRVHLATFTPRHNSSERKVAVKTVYNNNFNEEDVMREINLISRCRHVNIVEYVGHFKDIHGIHIVTEYMAGGDLHNFLIDESNKPTVNDAFLYILQIVQGMEYLTKQHIIHRDLAARNCMLDDTKTIIKITDFGLCRQSNIDYEYISESRQQIPFRWTAIECFESSRFSEKSDVWSFGVVVWEIFARNKLPYQGMDSKAVREFTTTGNRLEPIEFCPNELYTEIMLKCWEEIPVDRPSFSQLKVEIERIYWNLQQTSPEYLTTEYLYETPISAITGANQLDIHVQDGTKTTQM